MSVSSIFIAFPAEIIPFPRKDLLPLFVTGSPDYLTQLDFSGKTYYGKSIETPVSLESLESLGKNVLSLVSRICPDQKFSADSLVLLTNV